MAARDAGAPGQEGGFLWPPRSGGGPAASDSHVPEPAAVADERAHSGDTSSGPRSRWRDWLSDAERFWLDTTSDGARRRLARAGYTPDTPRAYCWRCGRSVGPFDADAAGCSACRGSDPGWLGLTRLGEYEHPLKGLIWEIKFTRFRAMGVELGGMLGESVRRSLGAVGREADGERTVVCSVGMPVMRRISRGIDHAAALAEGVARELRVPRAALLSRRWRDGLTGSAGRGGVQTGLGRSARRRNVRHTMRLRRPIGEGVDLVIIVDDVMTTGETMREACRAIAAGCARSGRATPSLWPALVSVTQTSRSG